MDCLLVLLCISYSILPGYLQYIVLQFCYLDIFVVLTRAIYPSAVHIPSSTKILENFQERLMQIVLIETSEQVNYKFCANFQQKCILMICSIVQYVSLDTTKCKILPRLGSIFVLCHSTCTISLLILLLLGQFNWQNVHAYKKEIATEIDNNTLMSIIFRMKWILWPTAGQEISN